MRSGIPKQNERRFAHGIVPGNRDRSGSTQGLPLSENPVMEQIPY
jgi:hypothetical protein